jgi:hypothetical protein
LSQISGVSHPNGTDKSEAAFRTQPHFFSVRAFFSIQ